MAELPEHLARLSPEERRAALKHLLAQQAERPAYHPLAAGQRTLWFLHHLGLDGGAQNFPMALHLPEPLDEAALRQSLRDLIERHPILRTTYELQAGEPVQRVAPKSEPFLELVDAKDIDESDLLARVGDYAYRPFDLESGPVFRVTLFQRSKGEQILLLVWHHIAMDGWSLMVALTELSLLYEFRYRGMKPDLPVGPAYSEFVEWQQRQEKTGAWHRHEEYWRAALGGDIPRLRLPPDHPASEGSEAAGAVTFLVNEALRSKLKNLAREKDTTLFTVLLTACQILFHRYTGREQVMVRVPTTGRPSHHFMGTLGFLVNQIVLRSEVRAEMMFQDLLAQTKQRVLEVIEHADYPLSLLLEKLPPSVEPGLARFSGAMFILQKLPGVPRESQSEDLSQEVSPLRQEDSKHKFGGVPVKVYPLEPRASGFELDFQLLDLGTKILGVVLYRRSMFEQVTVERWAHHLRTLFERVCDNPQARISDLYTLPQEQEQLLDRWNQTDKPYPATGIIELFEGQARRTPSAVAVEGGERRISYQELGELTDDLAQQIRSIMSGPESRVALFLPRSADWVVAMLSACKASATFVPIDPSAPSEEVGRVLAETVPAAILTTSALREMLPETEAGIVLVDDRSSSVPVEPVGRETVGPEGDLLFYVLFTSGSTGRPNGVMGTQAATLNRLHWMWEEYPYEPGEVVCLTSGPGFVDSVAATLGPLLKGVRVVIADQETLLDPDRFLDHLAKHQVTRLTVVPSLLRMLLGHERPLGERVPTLCHCVCSGEPLPASLACRFLEEAPNAVLLNLYGCSESAGDSTYYEMRSGCELSQVPIGRPIANTKVHILDEGGQRLPIGVAGEITIAGKGLAQGYWGQPELTARRFTVLSGAEERIYRTGDRGRYRYDGTIEFLGRLDRQVQIRGQRVEPLEIESVLETHPGVLQACVRPWSTGDEEPRLVAYVVPRAPSGVTAGELRGHVAARLADAKIPSAYVFLESLPRAVNGKLDVEGLPDPAEPLSRQREAVAPRNPVEEVVTAVWCDVLGVPELGIYDHFFELGGHSILVTRVIVRLREILRADIPIRLLFLHPTVAAFSSALLELPERERIEQVAAAVVEVSSLSEDEVQSRLQESPG